MINGKMDKKAGGYLLPDKKCCAYFNNLRKSGFILKAGNPKGLERQGNSQVLSKKPLDIGDVKRLMQHI